jgi:hypothetical protein
MKPSRSSLALDIPIRIERQTGLPKTEGTAVRDGRSAEFFSSHGSGLRAASGSSPGRCGSTPDFTCTLVRARCASS